MNNINIPVVSTMEEIQESWRRRWAESLLVRPPCYNRPAFEGPWLPGCSQWFLPAGNAYSQKKNWIQAKPYSWSACNGCLQKDQ